MDEGSPTRKGQENAVSGYYACQDQGSEMDLKITHEWLLEPIDGNNSLWVAIHRREHDSGYYQEYSPDDSMPIGFIGRAIEAIENLLKEIPV